MENAALPCLDSAEVLLIGGSAGAFEPLFKIIKTIPSYYSKALVIVIHRGKNNFTEIENLFAAHCRIKVSEISDKDKVCSGQVYIAPPNYHVLFEHDKTFALDVSEAIMYSKPSIDVTFESAAEVYGDKCAAILLSGANFDGSRGMLALFNSGAITIVQDPLEAEVDVMPLAAINKQAVQYILSGSEMLRLFN